MMNIKGIFAVSLIAMVAMVAGAHTSNAVAAIASQGYVDQQVGSKLSSISGSTTGSGNVVTSVSASGSTVSATKGITAEETKNKVTSTNYAANVSSDTKYPTVKAVAGAIADVEKKIPAAITVDSALSSTSTNPVQNKVINTALAGKQATLSGAQLNAVNSGITKDKVTTYDGYNEKITAAQNAADDAAAAANGKVTIAQGSGAVNKAVITNSSGNVTTGTISSGMIADGTITNADISASAAIAQSKISGLTTALAGKVATAQGSNAVNKAVITDASGNITTGQIASGMIAKDAVTADKIADGVIPTVNNATLTIQKNGESVGTFTANASANKEINIVVPAATTASDILTTTTVTSSGTGAVLTGVSVTAGKVTLQKGNVQIPSGGQNATSYVSIWVE